MTTEVTLRIEKSTYKEFMGFIRHYKKVEVVSEECQAMKRQRRKRGRPKHSQPVVKAFIYDGIDSSARLMMLCRGLMALGWIDQDTDIQLFIDLFSGGEIRRRIIWTGDMNILSELFRRLVNERKLIKLPANHSLWVMVNGHFWEKESKHEFGTDRLRNTHFPQKQDQTIAYMVNILDPKCSLEEICRMMESQR